MDIFVLSLDQSIERKLIFDNYNSKHITYTYHTAVDGKTIDIDALHPAILRKGSIRYSKNAIGAALSHLQLWDKCIELNKPIVIMEDDAIVSRDYNKHIHTVMSMLGSDTWDIVQLTYNFDSILSYNNTNYEICNSIFTKHNMTKTDITQFIHSNIHTTVAKLHHCFGMAAYVLHPNGARKLKERCFPLDNRIIQMPFIDNLMSYTIDCMMNSIYKEISAYVCVIPFVITPHISDDYKSTITPSTA